MTFCWKCGHKNDPESVFCEQCGVKLDDEKEVVSDEKKGTEPAEKIKTEKVVQVTPTPKKPMSKKNKLILGIVGGTLILGVGAYKFGENHYSYDKQVVRLSETIETKKPGEWADIMVSNDPNYKVTKDEMKKLTDYYDQDTNKEKFSLLIKDIKSTPENLEDFEIVISGTHFFFFDRYKIAVNPVYIDVTKEPSEVVVEIDGETYDDKKNEALTIGPLTPASYKLKGSLKEETSEQTLDLVRFQNDNFQGNTEVVLDLHKVSFLVQSNVEGAKVLVDKKEVATIKDGKAEVKDLVWHQGMTVVVEQAFGKKKINSASIEIGPDQFLASNYDKEGYNSQVFLEIDSIKTVDDVQYFLNDFYSDVSRYTNDYSTLGEREKNDFSKFFTSGKDNKEYADFISFITGVRDSKEKSSVIGTPTVESISMTDENVYHVKYLIEYETNYEDYKKDDIVQVFRYKQGVFRYNEKEKTFEIDDLGGEKQFEVVDNGGVS